MIDSAKQSALRALQAIPGVGKAVSEDLWNLGYRSIESLKAEDPQHMYDRLCVLQGARIDRCMLYTFRCAVYFASTKHPDPQKLKWWKWKD